MPVIDKLKVKKVVELLDTGKSTRQIEKELDIGKSTVSRIRQSLSESPKVPKSGRPCKLSDREKHETAKWLKMGKVLTASQACNQLNQLRDTQTNPKRSVSCQTVRNVIKEQGLVAKKKVPKPKLTAKHIKRRLKFVEKHCEWTVDDYKRVVWSDETKINKFNSDGMKWVYVDKSGSKIDERVDPKVKFGGGGIMIWGCMTWAGVGRIALVEGNMNADQYIKILEENLLATLDAIGIMPGFPSREDIIFQQDNDPKHTANKTKAWFSNNNIKPLPWPANSPDLNPIEHLWAHIKRQLRENYVLPPKGCFELWERVKEQWGKIKPEVCQNLIESMPRRLVAVRKARGRQTKY